MYSNNNTKCDYHKKKTKKNEVKIVVHYNMWQNVKISNLCTVPQIKFKTPKRNKKYLIKTRKNKTKYIFLRR